MDPRWWSENWSIQPYKVVNYLPLSTTDGHCVQRLPYKEPEPEPEAFDEDEQSTDEQGSDSELPSLETWKI